jgi:hypothetical protein
VGGDIALRTPVVRQNDRHLLAGAVTRVDSRRVAFVHAGLF